jgi:hypothetical protein
MRKLHKIRLALLALAGVLVGGALLGGGPAAAQSPDQAQPPEATGVASEMAVDLEPDVEAVEEEGGDAEESVEPTTSVGVQGVVGYDPRRFRRFMSGVETCLLCHGSYDIVMGRGATQDSLWVNPDRFLESVHATKGCTACHTNINPYGHELKKEPEQQPVVDSSGEEYADVSELVPTEEGLEAKVGERHKRTPALLACIKCHEDIYEQYRTTVHGVSVLEEGKKEPPYCIDCHGWHYILPSSDERSRTNPANIPQTCQSCHAQTAIKKRYGLTKDVAGTFKHSFHNRRGEMGSKSVAVCTSCHGWHDIYRVDDPRSKVNQAQVSQTCGQCHQGAQLNFAAAFTHGQVSRTEQVGIYAVTQVHKWMIVLIIGPLVLIVFMDLFRSFRKRAAVEHD